MVLARETPASRPSNSLRTRSAADSSSTVPLVLTRETSAAGDGRASYTRWRPGRTDEFPRSASSPQKMKTMSAVTSTDGTQIAYERAGSGPPVVLANLSLEQITSVSGAPYQVRAEMFHSQSHAAPSVVVTNATQSERVPAGALGWPGVLAALQVSRANRIGMRNQQVYSQRVKT